MTETKSDQTTPLPLPKRPWKSNQNTPPPLPERPLRSEQTKPSSLPEKPCRGDNWRTKIVQVKKAKHSLSYAVFIVHMKIRLHLGTINYVT